MTVSISWADARFADDEILKEKLSVELRDRVLKATGSQYLEAISRAALIPGCTERIFTIYEHLTAEITSRWAAPTTEDVSNDVLVLGCFARIFPLARYLRPLVTSFLTSRQFDNVQSNDIDDGDLAQLLLAVFRLLSVEPERISAVVKPTLLSRFFTHESLVVRYLAIQCMCIVMHFADALERKLVHAYVGDQQILGLWEGKQVDYRLLKLYEENRWTEFESEVARTRSAQVQFSIFQEHRLSFENLLSTTANVSGVLIPRNGPLVNISTSFVSVSTAQKNLQSLGRALLNQNPVLLMGQGGSGKTILIREAARLLNRLSSMITLHLNEQTDAKSLMGVYTSSASGDSFIWQPGVLTKAVQQGRWVLIEDIDRAPSEVLGVLRPIIENGELFLPSRKERIRPKEGFRVFATIKTSSKSGRGNVGRHAWLANERLWSTVALQQYSSEEVQDLLRSRYPSIVPLLPGILQAHEMVTAAYDKDQQFRAVQARLPSLRDLLTWCRRISRRVLSQKIDLMVDGMPEQMRFDVFKDGIDCYAAFHSDPVIYDAITRLIAQALHISPDQTEHVLSSAIFGVTETKSRVTIGRSVLQRVETRRPSIGSTARFALTNQAKITMESIAAGASNSEPLLLVGETGVGKTTQVQHIANLVNQKLTVVNLSQQSEAADLIGGLKPITTRSLMIPMLDQFSSLFDDTFSSKRNEKFQIAISKAVTKENWQRLVLLWQEAVQMAEASLKKPFEPVEAEKEGQSAKRRKLVTKYGPLRDRWAEFASKLNHVRAQVERGDKNHSFAFVEGRLVQAVRAGEWVLLDEINLASADTLDYVVGLLSNSDDEKPSLLLAEAGNVEQIIAHPNFRIFAAMNPATDTGKKDLAPGIRSRFTEIYVQSGDKDARDLVKIIETYLGPALRSDNRAALDLARAYLQLKKLNEEHKLTDGAGDLPHFSIRSLVRCLLYVIQHNASHGLRRSMYEGFAMSFFTVLSIESEKLALPLLSTHLLSTVRNVRSFLSQQPRMPVDEVKHVAFSHHLVLRGTNSPDLQPHYIRTPSVERNLLNLARAASMRRFPILLQGPTSAGKTSMVEYLAKFSGNQFVRINNHEHTDLQEYLGSYATGDDGKLEFREGVLVEALRKGHWIVLDELNLAPSDVLEALNRLLDDNRELLIPESQEIVRPHPNFMLFATQNPAGLYGGRKRLSRAFRNRFLELHFDDIPEDELEVILRERAQIAPSFCPLIVQVYKKLSLQRQSTRLFESRNSFATLRDLFRWAARPVAVKQELAEHGFMLLAERVRDPSERQLVKKTIEETMKIKIDEEELYGLRAIPDSVQSDSGIVWTSAMRRLFVLVSQALKNNEPILLVGETGCGKTQICQTIAQAFARPLSIYNAHSNTETGDLIGSQRPIRQRADLASALLDSFSQLYTSDSEKLAIVSRDVDELITAFGKMDTSGLEPSIVEKTRQSIAAYQSLFMWTDGSLVRSMKTGEHFLLDEISLADDSVLERLNSVLEPSRTILLAEKGPTENYVVAHPSFQFLATMNPGGDYGKRELSAALRNRLTEIWVPPLSQSEDILPILQSKLGERDSRLAQPMLEFATWFKNEMQTSTASTISLRSLLTWSEFIRTSTDLESEVAFVHGASLVYIDSLGANPAGLTNAIGADLALTRRLCLKELQSLSSIDVLGLYDEIPELQLIPSQLKLGSFGLPRAVVGNDMSGLVFEAPTTLRNTMRIVRALQMNRPILLEGSPGVGKTAIVTALATLVGKNLTRINLSDQTDLMDLFGADAPSENEKFGRFTWRDGPLLQAMQTGGWVLLDEMNLASQSVLEGLNSCLDHRHEVYIAELDKSFICHPEFTLFAAQNPHHQGGGRKGLPASFVNRFTVVYADSFQREDLMLICERKRPHVSETQLAMIIDTISTGHELVTKSHDFSAGGPWELNLRDINRWLDLLQENRNLTADHYFESVIGQRFRSPAARKMLFDLREQLFGCQSNLTLYHNLLPEVFQLGTTFLSRNDQLQHSSSAQILPVHHLPYAKSVITAINHKWPVLLVGPSGCGKTALIRNLAAFNGAKLVEFSMNADVDTMDLIGGFEQSDLRRDVLDIQTSIRSLLTKLICENVLSGQYLDTVAALLAAYERCSIADIELTTLLDLVRQLSQRINAFKPIHETISRMTSLPNRSRFVWNDGVLINALEEGSWLVLDNANLCNPSVLDRLNSLLEPDGVLAVSEQHSGGNEERIVRPHPSFRIFLTMDPRYGELSRAMRNRSLELYMTVESHTERASAVPFYPTSADIYRSRHMLRQMKQGDLHQANPRLVEPYLGALSKEDVTVIASQIGNFVDNSSILNYFESSTDAYQYMTPAMQDLWPPILSATRRLPDPFNQLKHLDVQAQPLMFVLNDALIKLLESEIHFPPTEVYARQWFLDFQRAHLQQSLRTTATHALEQETNHMTILQKSVLQQRQRPGSQKKQESFPDAYSFLKAIVLYMGQSDGLLSTPEAVNTLQIVLSLVRDIFDLFNQHVFNLDVFQAYVQVAKDVLRKLPRYEVRLKNVLDEALNQFHDQFVLQSGQSLHRMWPVLKTKTPSTLQHLGAKIAAEELLQRFDILTRSIPHRRSELAAIRLRLCNACERILEDGDPDATVKALSEAVETLSAQEPHTQLESGHLTGIFERLARKLVNQGKIIGELDLQRLLFFTRSLPVALDQGSTAISDTLRRLAYLNRDDDYHPTLSGTVLHKALVTVNSEPLSMLVNVHEELNELANVLSSHTTGILASDVHPALICARELLVTILRCHDDLFTPEARSCFLSNDDLELDNLARLSKRALDSSQTAQVGYFEDIYRKYLLPVISTLAQKDVKSSAAVGTCLILSCIAALNLFVPDKAFDPATYPTVVSQRHIKRINELQEQIATYRNFQRTWTGEEDSSIISMFKRDLSDLGDAPPTIVIARPITSELSTVQQEFTTVLRNVLNSNQMDDILSMKNMVSGKAPQVAHVCKNIQVLITRVVRRLSTLNRAYDDIVKPVLWLLESLSFGTKLIASDCQQHSMPASDMLLMNVVPLFGGTPDDITARMPSSIQKDTNAELSWLHQILFRNQIEHDSRSSVISSTLEFLSLADRFCDKWKTHLTQAQAEAEIKSRYYTYRGEDEATQEANDSEFAELFPTYEQDTSSEDFVSKTQYARNNSVKMGQLHCSMHNTSSVSASLQNHILNMANMLLDSSVDVQVIPLDRILPGTFLQLERAIEQTEQPVKSVAFDVYHDSDVTESRKLIDLVHRIQVRFKEISEQWPEHAIPIEVLTYSEEVLKFKTNEPLAKLLTKTEKLLEIVSQWQSVASREWSAANLMESLTSLIIHWRRLELSSWSKLLDLEDKKFEEDAFAWYFIAYEAVMYNTRIVVEQTTDISIYCLELAKTLEEFLRSTTIGQFNFRLKLLKAFERSLSILLLVDDRLLPIFRCLEGVLCHYDHYQSNIRQTLINGRSALEKDITEQIKLASWKDTNVKSLRDSAKRTHHKLFKVIRKYRALLSQPITSFKADELDMQTNLSQLPPVPLQETDKKQLQAQLARCTSSLQDWNSRPERLTDPTGAALSIRKLYEIQNNSFEAFEELASLRSDIASVATDLRKQTPSMLTEDNTSLVRHLRERKRRLFAETLRNVAQMGVRRNLATIELSKQSSISVVLARSPDIGSFISPKVSIAANAAFHESLDNMSSVRKAAIEHSDDLTDGETRRAIGLLEGLLSIEMTQRANLADTLLGLRSFHDVLQPLVQLQTLAADNVARLQSSMASKQQWIEKCLAWLPQILEVTCHILRFQSANGGFNVDALINSTQEQCQKLAKAKAELQNSMEIPRGLSISGVIAQIQAVEADLDEFGDVIKHWMEKEPNVAHLLNQVLPWTKPSADERTYTNGIVETAVDSLDNDVRYVLDSIFVAIQNVTSIRAMAPVSTEDVGWLTKSDAVHQDSAKALNLDSLAEHLREAVTNIQHLPEDELTLGLSVFGVATPILEQYLLVAKNVYERQLNTHYETCRLGIFLTKSFVSLANEGFCTPRDPSDGQEQKSGKLESGTGLGDGEGAEDISKDIGNDEDLSELAQAGVEEQEDEKEMDKQQDAVDMGADDLEGVMGSGDEKASDDEDDQQSGSDDEDAMDEETGSVDDLDPSAVDEKLWDDMRNDTEKEEKEMKGDKEKGQKSEEQTAKEDGPNEEGNDDLEGMEDDEKEENDEDDEVDGQGRPEAENIDPHLQEEQALDLPDEMQLTGEEEEKEGDISDDGMDELSDMEDVDQPEPEGVDKVDDEEMEKREGDDFDETNGNDNEEDDDAEGKAQDDEIIEDQPEEESEKDKGDGLDTRDNEMQYDLDDNEGGDTGTANQKDSARDETSNENALGQNEREEVVNEQQTQTGPASDKQQTGDASRGTVEQGVGQENDKQQKQDDALKKLAEVLEQYHQRREIMTASEERKQSDLDQDVDMNDADFEHLGNDEDNADAQALGAASAEQVQKLDESKAIEHKDGDHDQELPMPETQDVHEQDEHASLSQMLGRLQNQLPQTKDSSTGPVAPGTMPERSRLPSIDDGDLAEEDIDDVTMDQIQAQPELAASMNSSDTDAAALWSHCSIRTHALSLLLTEQLRLILAPTTATKLRGDFRTGKRLNIKRIIPYIASGYKRDKIWMRRSVPSKRNYQIMIAVDDSKSMSESGADLLAFETLAMLCKSLSMLEVGELCVVGFGDQDQIRLAHPFSTPFTGADSGVEVFKAFNFQQRGTDVRRLLRQSISIFEDARLRSTSNNSDDLWQLQLIISDGHCSDHDSIRRLVRLAHERKIMVVFVVVDAGQDSIVDLKEAVFELANPADPNSEMKVKTKRYLEGFPFGYYVVVRDVGDLPGVLARVLKGWFESVVNVG